MRSPSVNWRHRLPALAASRGLFRRRDKPGSHSGGGLGARVAVAGIGQEEGPSHDEPGGGSVLGRGQAESPQSRWPLSWCSTTAWLVGLDPCLVQQRLQALPVRERLHAAVCAPRELLRDDGVDQARLRQVLGTLDAYVRSDPLQVGSVVLLSSTIRSRRAAPAFPRRTPPRTPTIAPASRRRLPTVGAGREVRQVPLWPEQTTPAPGPAPPVGEIWGMICLHAKETFANPNAGMPQLTPDREPTRRQPAVASQRRERTLPMPGGYRCR